ncbi:MAG: glycosyltransferase, partial [Bdellovibrionales bacterium]|nr:glycosyltransferase [Bdellovibrionales bacterium]
LATERVLSARPNDWDVTLFVDPRDRNLKHANEPLNGRPALFGCPLHVYHRAFLEDQAEPFDLFLFHIEDHESSAFVVAASELWPGIVVLHDTTTRAVTLARFGHGTTGELLDAALQAAHGANAPKIGEWRARGWNTESLERRYLNSELSVGDEHVLVGGTAFCIDYLRAMGRTERLASMVFPVPEVSPNERDNRGRRSREDFGIPPQAAVVGFIGRNTIEHRHHTFLEAFAALSQEDEAKGPVYLLWLAADANEKAHHERLLEGFCESVPLPRERCIVAVSEGNDGAEIAACDLLVSLQFSLVRGIPRKCLEACSYGVPLVTLDVGSQAELPVASRVAIAPGSDEFFQLREALRLLLNDDAIRSQMGAAARAFAADAFSPAGSAADLQATFSRYASYLSSTIDKRRREFSSAEREHLQTRLRSRLEREKDPDEAMSEQMLGRLLSQAAADFGWGVTAKN